MYRIRIHGRGGQGIKTSSRMLGTAFFHEGFEVQDAPVYGAERRGAPMVAYVRAARSPIHERGAIANPDLVVVVDESLIPIPAANVLAGIGPSTVLLINSGAPSEEWRSRLNLAGSIVTLPTSAGSESVLEQAYTGSVCMGAASRLVRCINRASLERAIRDELQGSSEEVVARNVDHALDAYDAVEAYVGNVAEGGTIAARDAPLPDWVDVPFEAALISAPDIRAPATSVQIKTGTWRTTRPVIDLAICNRCTWVCSTLCPDSAIQVTADQQPEIDYDHCKGCLICVAVCPHHAISAVPESTAMEPIA